MAALEEIVENTPLGGIKIFLQKTGGGPKKDQQLGSIKNGTVIDHLSNLEGKELHDKLKLNSREGGIAYNLDSSTVKNKAVIKIENEFLEERELKQVGLKSPDITINEIENGRVTKKYKLIVCENEKCKSRKENKPMRFRVEKNKLLCNYCDTKHTSEIEGKERYISNLESDLNLLPQAKNIEQKVRKLAEKHCLSGTDFDKLQQYKEKNKHKKQLPQFEKRQIDRLYKIELTEQRKEYIKEIENLAKELNSFIINSIFYFKNYDRENKCRQEELKRSIHKKVELCGLEGLAAKKSIEPAIQYSEENILETEGNYYRLNNADKERSIYEFNKNFEPKIKIISRMIRAVDNISQ